MIESAEFIARIALVLIPMYLANATAMLLGGGIQLDLKKKFFDERELFGKGKTWRGSIAGIAAGMLGAILLFYVLNSFTLMLTQNYLFYGTLLSIGAILGDIAGSFLKRRLNIAQGKPTFPLDQLDFVFGGLLLGGIYFIPTLLELAVIVVFTVIVHKMANFIAFKIKLKKVPW